MKLLVFIGPSGSGKSTVVRELHRRSVIAVTPSWTTRPRRDDETRATIEHRFVSSEEFSALERRGFFLEVVDMFGLQHRYGLPEIETAPVGVVPAIMVRAPLLPLVAKHYPHHVVYQIESACEVARERVLARRRPASEVGTRIEDSVQEQELGRRTACRVFDATASPDVVVGAVELAIAEDFPGEGSGHR